MGDEDINQNQRPEVYKTFDDGYIVRGMTLQDAKIVQKWYSALGIISRYDLDLALSVFPPQGPGFYIGEYNGEVVSSAIRLPWGVGPTGKVVYYGSYYYVAEAYRKSGYGTRLRDQVAREHVGENILCVDAIKGKVSENNKARHGYVEAFKTERFQGEAKAGVFSFSGSIKLATEVPFDDLIKYDNKCFVSADCPQRRAFLKEWIAIPGGASYVALDDNGEIIGLGCRRPCLQEGNHMVGPLYAGDAEVANGLFQRLCDDVLGSQITINIWYTN